MFESICDVLAACLGASDPLSQEPGILYLGLACHSMRSWRISCSASTSQIDSNTDSSLAMGG